MVPMNDVIFADFHVHTHLSPCGKPEATALAMIQRSAEKGFAAIGFADHITPAPVPGCPFYDRQRPVLLSDLRSEIAEIAGAVVIEILVGVEADFTMAGPACLNEEMPAEVDHVVCAASHFHLPAAPLPKNDGPRATAELMLRVARGALHLPGVSIWAHPFACNRMRPLTAIMESLSDDELAFLIDLAGERDVAIEINGASVQHEDYRQSTSRFMALAMEMGARFTLTADAHHPRDFDRFDLARQWARELGLRDDRFLSAGELLGKQKHRLAMSKAASRSATEREP